MTNALRKAKRYKSIYILLDKKGNEKEYTVRNYGWDTYKAALNMKHEHLKHKVWPNRKIKIKEIKV